MNYIIRKMYKNEYYLLKDFLYEAIFQPTENKVSKDIANHPSLKIYFENFGDLKDDYSFCALIDEKIIGAVWVRNINGFGKIDNSTPELSISLYEEYRNLGIGTSLIKRILEFLKTKNYKQVSLSVQKENSALNLYLRLGFKIILDLEEEVIMKYEL